MIIPEVYIFWHRRCDPGFDIAQSIFDWLRPGAGMGPAVFFRSLPEPGHARNEPPAPLPDPQPAPAASAPRKVQVVIPLVDASMVADPAWRQWLERHLPLPSQDPPDRIFFPVALDDTAFNLTPSLRGANFIRSTGRLLAGKAEPGFDLFVRPLLRQLTEAMTRLVLPRPGGPGRPGGVPPKINVFLSHAKKDGTIPTRALLDHILGRTQLSAFFDENDIGFGATFAGIIEQSLASPDTAALIAVRTAEYAFRPWCRREVSLFRRPRAYRPGTFEICNDADPVARRDCEARATNWRLYPTLVVEAMAPGQFSPGIPEFGGSPVIRWDVEEHGIAETIVTTLIRDAMIAACNDALGHALPPGNQQIAINWMPEPTSLLHIPALRNGDRVEVFYPGHGLTYLELAPLDELFPQAKFTSFEEKLTRAL